MVTVMNNKENCYILVKRIYNEFSQRLGKNFVNTTTTKYKEEDTQMLYDLCESIIHNYNKLYK